jgi:deoxyribodipyrimidine photolyase-related protein
MKTATLLFPHQLSKDISALQHKYPIYLIEEYLFFKQYPFHKQKLAFHRASMKFYQNYLETQGFYVHYIASLEQQSDIRVLIPKLVASGIENLIIIDPTDNWLENRINAFKNHIHITYLESHLFINPKHELSAFFKTSKKKFFQTTFYKEQRRQRHILMSDGQPVGGKWTYDTENRKKYPKDKTAPNITFPKNNAYYEEALDYVGQHFKEHLGLLETQQIYPVTFTEAEDWLVAFFETRFFEFGDYEDAIVKEQHFLNHSVLSPLINVGLLSPEYVIEKALSYADDKQIPINSLEGFIRQILGWREFIRGIYEVKGKAARTKNFWNHKRSIPSSFYDGTTGIAPVDQSIKKILKTGYAHHIERLMILGNFMLLCEFDPDEVYQWFMELFIDSYDWVMVPNVYGMSLFADGGLMATKPYISSSNYIKKMSNYPPGDWQAIWDGLFWRFMDIHRAVLSKNPRLRMLINHLDKMTPEKRLQHNKNATNFLDTLTHNSTPKQLNLL